LSSSRLVEIIAPRLVEIIVARARRDHRAAGLVEIIRGGIHHDQDTARHLEWTASSEQPVRA